jgi:hypothetical protein
MKIKVVSVADDSFDGKDGRVTAAKLRYLDLRDEGERRERELSGYGPPMAGVLAWPAGSEQEIEPYTTKSGKQAFRLPGGGGGGRGGGGGFAAAYRNTAEGHAAEQERMDRRTALMQATAIFQTTMQTSAKTDGSVQNIADGMYEWLRKTAKS